MKSSEDVKRFIGKSLINICDLFPKFRPWLRGWGLRTRKEWFGRRVVEIQLPNGQSFKLASAGENYLSFQLFWLGGQFYEPITAMVIKELVGPGDVFVDAGANIGFHSLRLAATQPEARIVAFEPNPKIYALLADNVAANEFIQIRCEPCAVSDGDGHALLYLSASDHSASLRRDFSQEVTGQVEVTSITLDSYLKHHAVEGRPVLKLDLEGNEDAAFRGAWDSIASRRPDIIVEVALAQEPDFAALLRERGYNFYSITDQGLRASPVLRPVVRGPFVFLNYLLSARPAADVAALFNRIEPQVKKIDLWKTSKRASRLVIERALADSQPNNGQAP